MSHKRNLPFKVAPTLWVVLVAVVYFILWKGVLRWTGKWPGPYWFAVGLGVLVTGGVLRTKRIHFAWLIPFACFTVFVTWFFSLGIYRTWARALILHEYRWYYQNWWPEKVPTVAVMTILLWFLPFVDRPKGMPHRFVAAVLFAAAFLSMLVFAEPVCSFYLPRAGTMSHGNYDIFGFRLGGYYLLAVVMSVSLLKFVLLPRRRQSYEKPPNEGADCASSPE